ncbi:MAG: hypothetical protein RSG50_03175, partial [Clostridia bacterium]
PVLPRHLFDPQNKRLRHETSFVSQPPCLRLSTSAILVVDIRSKCGYALLVARFLSIHIGQKAGFSF